MGSEIDNRQLISMLFISRIFSVLTYNPRVDPAMEGAVSMLSTLLTVPFTLLVLLPIFLILKRYPGDDFLISASRANPIWGKVVAGVFFVSSMLMVVYSACNFQYFLSTAVYPDFGGTIFVVCFVLVVAYAVYMGLQAFARFSNLLMILVMLSSLMVILALTKDVNMVHLHSPLEHGFKPLVKLIYLSLTNNYELLAFTFLTTKIRGGKHTSVFWMMLLSFCYYQIIVFTVTVTLGEYGLTQTFPIYSMMASAEITLFQRLDALHMAMWVFVTFMKCTLYFYMARESLSVLLKNGWRRLSMPITLLLAMVFCLIISERLGLLISLLALLSSGIPFLIAMVVVPVVTLLWLLIGGRKKEVRRV